MAAVGRQGMKSRFLLQKLTFLWNMADYILYLFPNKFKETIFSATICPKIPVQAAPATRQSEAGPGKDDAKKDDIYNRLHNDIFCRLRQLRTTASG
jgi:hypothetical protein